MKLKRTYPDVTDSGTVDAIADMLKRLLADEWPGKFTVQVIWDDPSITPARETKRRTVKERATEKGAGS